MIISLFAVYSHDLMKLLLDLVIGLCTVVKVMFISKSSIGNGYSCFRYCCIESTK